MTARPLSRNRRLRLETLEDRLALSVSPTFDDTLVSDVASVNATANRTAPDIGIAADGSYVVAWQFNDAATNQTDIYARRFNSDGTPRTEAYVIANAATNESQPSLAVAADGSYIVAYTKVVPLGSTNGRSVFFQMFNAADQRLTNELEAPRGGTPGTPDYFSPDVAVSDVTGQFIIVWVQQATASNRDIYARAFHADGTALTFNDVAVGTTIGNEFNPQVAIKPNASDSPLTSVVPVISYTLDQGNGVQKVYFRRYSSVLSPLDTFATGIPVSGSNTSVREDESAIALDASGNLLIAYSAKPRNGASQVLFQQFDLNGIPTFFSPGFVDGNDQEQTAPSIAINGDGRFLIAYVTSVPSQSPQAFFREFGPDLQPIGAARTLSSAATPSNGSPRLASTQGNFYVAAIDDFSRTRPEPVTRGFTNLTSRVGVVRANNAGLAQFSVDSNGNNTFDANDNVFTFGFFSDQFVIGDWNASGYDKIGVVRPNGVAAVFSLDTNGDGTYNPATDNVFLFGLASDKFLIGDWNGDGRSKIGVVRPSDTTAIFSLDVNGNGAFEAADKVFTFGLATDTFVIGDWNGDGISKIGVVRAAADGTAVWSLDSNGNGTFDAADRVVTFGRAGDTFVVGDWNGDGITKIGAVRTGTGLSAGVTFILDTNGSGREDAGDQSFNFGSPGDSFVIGKWLATPRSQATAALHASSAGPGGAGRLTDAVLASVVRQAIDSWAATGLDAAQVERLRQVPIQIGSLDAGLLGVTRGNTIVLDDDAAGWGWHTDAGSPSAKEMDLLTAVAHEMGHLLGLEHDAHIDDVMAEALLPGTRRLPA